MELIRYRGVCFQNVILLFVFFRIKLPLVLVALWSFFVTYPKNILLFLYHVMSINMIGLGFFFFNFFKCCIINKYYRVASTVLTMETKCKKT